MRLSKKLVNKKVLKLIQFPLFNSFRVSFAPRSFYGLEFWDAKFVFFLTQHDSFMSFCSEKFECVETVEFLGLALEL